MIKSKNELRADIEHWKKVLITANNKVEMYRLEVVKLTNEKNNKPAQAISTKQMLETQLADINYKEKYPLCHAIKEAKCIFVEFYVHGKSIGKFTKDGAEDYARKNLKQDYSNQLSEYIALQLCFLSNDHQENKSLHSFDL